MHNKPKAPAADPRKSTKHLEPDAVLAYAAGLRRTALPGALHLPLRGQNIGLLCGHEQAPAVEAFRDAAADLGAQVAIIRSDLAPAGATPKISEIARLLSRLYDAVACDGIPDEIVDQLAQAATIPVTSGHIAAAEQADRLAGQLPGSDPLDQKRRRVLHALVMQSLC